MKPNELQKDVSNSIKEQAEASSSDIASTLRACARHAETIANVAANFESQLDDMVDCQRFYDGRAWDDVLGEIGALNKVSRELTRMTALTTSQHIHSLSDRKIGHSLCISPQTIGRWVAAEKVSYD